MICRKCKKECLESELKDGICQDCAAKDKNHIIVQTAISVVISVVLSLTIIGWANNEVSLSDFKIESFDMETEKTTYTYTGDSLTYSGKGIISCKNKDKDYLVLIEENNKTSNGTDYNYVVVHNGKGEFSTYDSSYLGAKEKPSYEFNIIGYRSFKK